MTVEKADVIDRVGVRPDGSAVELLISDHLEWNDPRHAEVLAAKVEAYANAVLAGQLVQSYPAAAGKNACIKLIYQHSPDSQARRLLDKIAQQLANVGIGFAHMSFPKGY